VSNASTIKPLNFIGACTLHGAMFSVLTSITCEVLFIINIHYSGIKGSATDFHNSKY